MDRVARAVSAAVLRAARRLDRAAERSLLDGPAGLAPLLLSRGARAPGAPASAAAGAAAALRAGAPSVDGALALLAELNYAASLLEDTPGSPRAGDAHSADGAGAGAGAVRVGDTVLVGGGRALVVGRAPRGGGLLVLDDDAPRLLAAAAAAAPAGARAAADDGGDGGEDDEGGPIAPPAAAASVAAPPPPSPPRAVPAAAVTRIAPALILHASLPRYASAFTAGARGGWALSRELEALYTADCYAARPLPDRVAARVAATAAARERAAAAERARDEARRGVGGEAPGAAAARAVRAGARA